MVPLTWIRAIGGPLLRAIGTAIVAGTASCAAAAQPVSGRVALTAGSATDERGVRSDAIAVAPEQSFALGAAALLTLSGSGTKYGSGAWQAGAAAQLASRANVAGPLAVSFNGGGGVSRSSYGASFGVADATPALELSTGSVTWFGGGHVASSRTSIRTGPTPLPLGGSGTTEISRTSVGPVYGLQWLVSGAEAPVSAVVSVRGEHARVAGETVVDRAAGVQLRGGMLTFGGSVGDRSAPTERGQYGNLSVALNVMPRVSFEAAVGQYPTNRLTNAAGGRYVTAGLAFAFGAGIERALPEPSGVGSPRPGYTRLSISAPNARSVELYGDWNGWTAVPAMRATNGVWYADLPLDPGEYRYAFRVDGGAWRVPEGAVATTDEFGGRSAYVTVARRSNTHGN